MALLEVKYGVKFIALDVKIEILYFIKERFGECVKNTY